MNLPVKDTVVSGEGKMPDAVTGRRPTWQEHLLATLRRCALAADLDGSVDFQPKEADPLRGCINEFKGLQEDHADLVALVRQYRSDLLHPPAADSRERRIKAIDAALAASKSGEKNA